MNTMEYQENRRLAQKRYMAEYRMAHRDERNWEDYKRNKRLNEDIPNLPLFEEIK